MNFYERFLGLCNGIGKTPSGVAAEIGIARSTVNKWKNGGNPTDATALKIANYFKISFDELINKKEPTDEADELMEYLEMLRTRPECRMLMSTVKGATKEQVEANVKFLESLRKK
ncbi:MAG: helix-turn-helix transcriptional regulator [Clostridia bacterium]|nr:helix-turn-helix transcriptional regulator [Clostridia bacterium]